MKYLNTLILILFVTGCASKQTSYCDFVDSGEQARNSLEKELSKADKEVKKKPSTKPL